MPTSAGLVDLVEQLERPRAVWVMVPAGAATQHVIDQLANLLRHGDTVIDGGNSRWTDDEKHAEELAKRGINFVDAGVSGGVWGLKNGYALMVGGEKEVVDDLDPIFDALKPEGPYGYVHAGKVGAGHFSKMVHNGIEYAMMQAYAEGWELLEKVDLRGQRPRGLPLLAGGHRDPLRLLDLAVNAPRRGPPPGRAARLRGGLRRGPLTSRRPSTTPAAARDHGLLFARFASRQDDSPQMKMIAALRNQFGGHAVEAAKK